MSKVGVFSWNKEYVHGSKGIDIIVIEKAKMDVSKYELMSSKSYVCIKGIHRLLIRM